MVEPCASADARRRSMPGTLLLVADQGVLLTGESGTGKSLLALGLLDRGHTLICDDVVELERRGDALLGFCPDALTATLELRGAGLVDVRTLFGNGCWHRQTAIDRVLHLQPLNTARQWADWPRPTGRHDRQMLEDLAIPRLTVPVGPRGISPLLVESVVRTGSPVRVGERHG